MTVQPFDMERSAYNTGFSVIEILVSVAIFSVVIMAGTLSVLSIIDANQKSQTLNSVMTNLNTALESMARDIRVGTDYSINTAGTEITFRPDRGCVDACLIYRYNPATESIERKNGSTDQEFLLVTAEEVHVTGLHFSLLNSDAITQPAIVMKVKGYAQTRTNTRSEFFLQTLMSQRLIQ